MWKVMLDARQSFTRPMTVFHCLGDQIDCDELIVLQALFGHMLTCSLKRRLSLKLSENLSFNTCTNDRIQQSFFAVVKSLSSILVSLNSAGDAIDNSRRQHLKNGPW